MSIVTACRPSVKPTCRHTRPFGEGILESDQPGPHSILPTIAGDGLNPDEESRLRMARIRGRGAYAGSVPGATESELRRVGDLCASDCLRRILYDRRIAADRQVPGAIAVDAVEVSEVDGDEQPSDEDRRWWARESNGGEAKQDEADRPGAGLKARLCVAWRAYREATRRLSRAHEAFDADPISNFGFELSPAEKREWRAWDGLLVRLATERIRAADQVRAIVRTLRRCTRRAIPA